MTHSATIGALALAPQTGKGVTGTSFTYVPATSIGLNMLQQAQALPLEIGGGYFPKSSYKTSVAAGGDVSIIARPDSFGHFLFMLCGADTVTPVAGQAGAYSHVMTPFVPSVSNDLPWYTVVKDAAKMWAEQYVDVRLSRIRMDVAKQSIVSTTCSLFGITPSEIAVPGSETFDTGPDFQTCQTTVSLFQEGQGTNISAQSVQVERISLDFGNRLSQDEYVVGAYTPADITLLSKDVQITYDIVIRDQALRRAVYQNGGTSAWSPTVYRGDLTLLMASNTNVASTTQPYQLTVNLPGIDFLMMPITMQAGEVMRASLSANVTLGPSGSDTYTFTLINATASY